MFSAPKTNWILAGLYAGCTLIVFVLSVVFPQFRAVAYAPLRDLLLPEPEPITLSVLYSTEKEAWLEEAVSEFARTRPRLQGHPVEVTLSKMGSREMVLAVLDEQAQPDMISPASLLQISLLEELSASKFGQSIVNPSDTTGCRPVLNTPLVLVAWKERADVLWGDNPDGNLWLNLHDALINPQGWAAYDRSEWGYIKFSHTNPLKSNSGFQTILLMTYNYLGKTGGLTGDDILSNRDYQQWFIEFENTISKFGDSTGTYMTEIVAYGPSLYDIVAVYEATAIENLENAVGRYGELQIYYPPTTLLSEHPFCVLQADWVKPDNAKAAQFFLDFLTSRDMQQLALLKYGFRPVDPGIPLEQTGSPLTRYTGNGLRIKLPPLVEVPSASELNILLDFWQRNVQR
jgi:ABC-type Fe3+ transport system substrate-binding protein